MSARNETRRTEITIGEVENGGDVGFTARQISGVEGVEDVEFVKFIDDFAGRFHIAHTFPRSELIERLEAAGVCV